MNKWLETIDNNRQKALDEFNMRGNGTWIKEDPGEHYVRINPYDIKKRHVPL